jgi:vanillate O-demethylase monooxygenase subunit
MRWLRNAWYAAAWSHEVSQGLFARTLLGQSVLMFRNTSGEAQAIENRCPHRFAPLHLGRLRGDHVECGYHGLRFDGSGACVHNPHGDGRIPKACRVRSFPLAERHGILWIWPGEAVQADAQRIPDFSHVVAEGTRTVYGGHLVRANYELIADNLMDASHTQFVHMDLLGTEALERSRHEVIQQGSTVHSNYVFPDSVVPAAYREYFPREVRVVDYSVNFRWQPPGVVRNSVSLTPVDQPQVPAIRRIGTHLMTPETETTTHYFYCHTRNFDLGSAEVDERVRSWQKKGLLGQDTPMIEACQASMGTVDLDALGPALFSIDSAAVRVRRELRRLIEREARPERLAAPA